MQDNNDVKYLFKLNNENIVNFYEYFFDQNRENIYLVYEFCEVSSPFN